MTAEKRNTISFGKQTEHRKLMNVQNKSCVELTCVVFYTNVAVL